MPQLNNTSLKYNFFLYSIFFCWFLFPSTGFSQSRSQLEKRREETQKEIAMTTRLLKEAQSDKENTIEKLNLIKRRIDLRNQVINDIELEISTIDKQIRDNEEIVLSLENDLKRLKDEYARLIYYAYKNHKSYDRLMFIFSARDFNTAYQRIKYLQQYTAYREKQADVIVAIQNVLNKKLVDLQISRENKVNLRNEQAKETTILEVELSQQDILIRKLKSKEKELLEALKKSESIARKLENEIEALIAAEAAKPRTGSGNNMYSRLTPEEKLISDDFKNNRGRLPWPTKTGVVTGTFGEHNHPVLSGIKIRNNGIDITTDDNSEVRAVFGGVVTKVLAILGANYTVIIRHGNYLTVYQNLVNVRVKAGDLVVTKQLIGEVFEEASKGGSVLHFEIWQELNKLDPQEWLSR